MNYFVTGGTGFIGRFLIAQLLKRNGTVYALSRNSEADAKIEQLRQRVNASADQLVAIRGDLNKPALGLSDTDRVALQGQVDHFFHLAAIYDLNAARELQVAVNVGGTAHAIACATQLKAGCFHHVSSIAVAGMYRGWFREDMFEQAERLDHPYLKTKHESEKCVREQCPLPWRIYRPGMVIGHSQTGEADRVDGPYYFFKLLQKLRNALPRWMPTLGVEGGRLNIVPVDYVAEAMDHIAHLADLDQRCFHLTDPDPYRTGEVLNIFADAGHAPRLAMRFDARMLSFIPAHIRNAILALPPVKRMVAAVLKDLGIPADALQFINYPTQFDCRETELALKGSGISCPRLPDYAAPIWDYWERHLDPALFVDHSLKAVTKNRIVMITGASSGIGKATALKLAEAGAEVLLVARDLEKLKETQAEVNQLGGQAHIYSCNLADQEACDELITQVLDEHGRVDILINNAGRSIRRAIDNAFDRFHDYERTMQLNYFGALKLTLGFIPAMLERRGGHIINISSIGVLTNAPRFSAYVASKAAMDAFSRCAAAEFSDRNIDFTTINMPLVRTPMIEPTKIYQSVPTLSPDEAADLVVQAIIYKPKRITTRLGTFGAFVHAVFPKLGEIIMNTGFRMFPDTPEAEGEKRDGQTTESPSAELLAFAAIMRGIHL